MPIFPGDALGIGVGMDGQNLGVSLRTWRVRVNVQVAKIAAERLVAFHVERLIAKEQDLKGLDGLLHLYKRLEKRGRALLLCLVCAEAGWLTLVNAWLRLERAYLKLRPFFRVGFATATDQNGGVRDVPIAAHRPTRLRSREQ